MFACYQEFFAVHSTDGKLLYYLVGRPLVIKQWEQNVTKSVHLWCIFNDNVSWAFIKQNIFIVYFFFVFSVNSPNAIHSSDNHTTGDEPLPPRCTLNLSEFQIPTYFGEWGGKGKGVFFPSVASFYCPGSEEPISFLFIKLIMYPKK